MASSSTSPLAPRGASQPGRIATAVRSMATLSSGEFRSRLLRAVVPFVAFLIANAVVGASSLGRTTRAVVSAPLGLGMIGFGLVAATLLLGRFVEVQPKRFRTLAAISAFLLAEIIVSGAAVRLTGSGLGCTDWPTCSQGRVLPGNRLQSRIEFGNRAVTLVLILIAAMCVLAAIVRRPYRRDLVTYGWVISALIFGNAIVGGAVVLFHLKSGIVSAHFLLSVASLTAGMVLYFRAGEPGTGGDFWGRDRISTTTTQLRTAVRVSTVLVLIGISLGTIATGSGPHSGDPAKTERLPFGIQAAARVHSMAMWCALLSVVAIAVLAARTPGSTAVELRRRVTWLMGALVVQGGIGYLQYARQLPAGLVEVHVLGATIVWMLLCWVRASVTAPGDASLRGEGAVSPV